jgi:fermentation-respiration switch protein FrsA (DUF1100 family)
MHDQIEPKFNNDGELAMTTNETTGTQSAEFEMGRRDVLMMTGATAAAFGVAAMVSSRASAQQDEVWDKKFAKSDRVDHRKVTYVNRLGIKLVADLYIPKDIDQSTKHPALVVGHPFGGVKEQTAGLYAQTMAERGFVTLAHDASYQGESGPGLPHFIASPEAFQEDFSAGVDFLGVHPLVDREQIGVIGICGSGGFALGATQGDPRIKALVAVVMYDIGRANRFGLHDAVSEDSRRKNIEAAARQRWVEAEGGEKKFNLGVVEQITADADPISKEFFDYYRTPRGAHPRSTTAMSANSTPALMQSFPADHLDWINPRPVLLVTGETAHSRFFSEDIHRALPGPKELHVVPGAGHVDLYDKVDLIPWDKLQSFFEQNLSA